MIEPGSWPHYAAIYLIAGLMVNALAHVESRAARHWYDHAFFTLAWPLVLLLWFVISPWVRGLR